LKNRPLEKCSKIHANNASDDQSEQGLKT